MPIGLHPTETLTLSNLRSVCAGGYCGTERRLNCYYRIPDYNFLTCDTELEMNLNQCTTHWLSNRFSMDFPPRNFCKRNLFINLEHGERYMNCVLYCGVLAFIYILQLKRCQVLFVCLLRIWENCIYVKLKPIPACHYCVQMLR